MVPCLVQLFCDLGCDLGESPSWDGKAQKLLSVDINHKRIYICDATGSDPGARLQPHLTARRSLWHACMLHAVAHLYVWRHGAIKTSHSTLKSTMLLSCWSDQRSEYYHPLLHGSLHLAASLPEVYTCVYACVDSRMHRGCSYLSLIWEESTLKLMTTRFAINSDVV